MKVSKYLTAAMQDLLNQLHVVVRISLTRGLGGGPHQHAGQAWGWSVARLQSESLGAPGARAVCANGS